MKTTQMNHSLSVKEKSAKIKIDTLKNTYEFEGFFLTQVSTSQNNMRGGFSNKKFNTLS